MKGRLFHGVWVQPGTRMMEFLEANPPETKKAEKLLKALNKMSEGNYSYEVVQQVRNQNPDLF